MQNRERSYLKISRTSPPCEGGEGGWDRERGVAKRQGILPIEKSSSKNCRVLEWISPDFGFLSWFLPGHGKAYANCGLLGVKGCLNVGAHKDAHLDDLEAGSKAYFKVFKQTCARAECPFCYESWASKEAHAIDYRLTQYRGVGRPIHVIISPPKKDWYLFIEQLRPKAYKNAKNCGFLGGSCIFHPFREELLTKRWYFSPHFHLIGYGWIKSTAKNYERTGWIVKNAGIRKSVEATAFYQLSHAGVHKHHHTITWFGKLSYNKMRVAPEVVKPEVCPICGAELVKLRWLGEGECPIPMQEGEYFCEPWGWWRERWKH